MEIVYLYCAFSYLFMMGALVNIVDEKPVFSLFIWIMSPIIMPIHIGNPNV